MDKVLKNLCITSLLSLTLIEIAHASALDLPATPEKPKKKLVRSIEFSGTSLSSGQLRFTGLEELYENQGGLTKITTYYSSTKEILLWDEVTFNRQLFPSSYKRWGKDPSFRLHLKNEKNQFILNKNESKEIRKPWNANALLPKTLHEFVLKNIKELRVGRKKEVSLFLPDLGRSANFWIIPTLSKDEMILELKVKNFLLRAFAPKVQFSFSKKTGDVLSYVGPTLFEMKNLTGTKIRIQFKTTLNNFKN